MIDVLEYLVFFIIECLDVIIIDLLEFKLFLFEDEVLN